jgi:hypothetical protein
MSTWAALDLDTDSSWAGPFLIYNPPGNVCLKEMFLFSVTITVAPGLPSPAPGQGAINHHRAEELLS